MLLQHTLTTASDNPVVTWPIKALTITLMDDLERISVGIANIGGIVSRIVFQPCAGRNVVLGTSGHCSLVEFIDLIVILATKPQ